MRKKNFQIILKDPVLIARAPAEIKTWGYYQFPKLTRLPDTRLLLSFQMAPDSALSYGNGGRLHYISADEGQSFYPAQMEFDDVEHLSLFQGHLPLKEGSLMSLRCEKAPPATDVSLPEPHSLMFFSYDNTRCPKPLFSWHELPESLQGIPVGLFEKGEWKCFRGACPVKDDLRAPVEGVLPVIFFGNLRQATDGSVLAGVYPNYCLREDGSVDTKCSIAFYRTTDLGQNWSLQGRIFYQPDNSYDPLGEIRRGFTEVSFEILDDESLLSIMRTTDASPGQGPLYQARSFDQGKTWTRPEVIHPFGVEPALIKLGNGMLLLSYGRPGVQARLCVKGDGTCWQAPRDIVEAKHTDAREDSCGYTSLLALTDNSALIAYSHFGPEGKGIFVRRLEVQTYGQRPELEVEEASGYLNHEVSGRLFCTIPLKDKLVTGLSSQYFENGEKAVEMPFREGLAHGRQRFYSREGWCMEEAMFFEDYRHGPRRFFDKLGHVIKETYYKDGYSCSFEEWIQNHNC